MENVLFIATGTVNAIMDKVRTMPKAIQNTIYATNSFSIRLRFLLNPYPLSRLKTRTNSHIKNTKEANDNRDTIAFCGVDFTRLTNI